ncbi:MAG: DUF5659 domain-containing protein [Nitrospirota bacterium]
MGIVESSGKQLFRISDIYVAAFHRLSNLSFTLETKERKIFFCFEPSPELYWCLQSFNEDVGVGVESFSREIKRMRALMLEAKQKDGG